MFFPFFFSFSVFLFRSLSRSIPASCMCFHAISIQLLRYPLLVVSSMAVGLFSFQFPHHPTACYVSARNFIYPLASQRLGSLVAVKAIGSTPRKVVITAVKERMASTQTSCPTMWLS
jgi:hypothetical protein